MGCSADADTGVSRPSRAVNSIYVLLLTPLRLRPGYEGRGIIVNLSSMYGIKSPDGALQVVSYTTTKHGTVPNAPLFNASLDHRLISKKKQQRLLD